MRSSQTNIERTILAAYRSQRVGRFKIRLISLLLCAYLLATAPVSNLLLPHFRLDQRASVVPASTGIPADRGRHEDEAKEGTGVIHVYGGDWANCGQDEDDGHKEGPGASPDIDSR